MAKLNPLFDGKGDVNIYVFYCQGCGYDHPMRVKAQDGYPSWDFDGNLESPTFSPSLLVFASVPEKRCHLMIHKGKIEYCSDCFHDLAGKTIEIPEYER